MYKKIDDDVMKKLHDVQIEILDEIVRVCDELGIDYYLIGGTLLGAIRHKGFIPWDDDVDLGMLREDYEVFISNAPSILDDKYDLQCYETDDKCYFPFVKIRKKNTIFNEDEIKDLDVNKGIFVDIFPMEVISNPNSKKLRVDAMLIKNIWEVVLLKTGVYKSAKGTRHPFLSKALSMFSLNYLKKWQMKLLRKQNSSKGNYVSILVGAYNYRKDTYKKSELIPTSKVLFEDKYYKSFANPDYYLKHLYGDYMKLPPKEKRVNHAPEEIVFDTKSSE